LKHQEFPTRQELTDLRKHCQGTTLIPGAEINVFVDALSKKINKDYFFHCIVAVDPDMSRDYGYVLKKAKDQFTYKGTEYPAGFHSSILDLGAFFRKHGALFIPAHLHQSKSPENSRSIDDLYDDEAFLDSFPTAPLMPWKSDSRPQQNSLMEPERPATDLRFRRPSA
jgi:hypothetical protein